MNTKNTKNENSPLLPAAGTTITKDSPINNTEDHDPSIPRFQVYKRRWYILSLYTAIALDCNMAWNTWGPISEPCEIMFGWGNWQVLFLTSWAAISLIFSALPSTYMMDIRGLRGSVILCAFLLTLGKVFQVIPSSNPLTRTILLNIGQGIAMLSCPVGLGAPPSISATWFPPEERTTATAISTLVGYIGLPMAFIIGPNMVQILEKAPSTNTTLLTNASLTNYATDTMTSDLTNYMGVQLGMSAFLLVCTLVYFPDKPPLPPCVTSSSPRHGYAESIKALLVDRSYLHLVVVFSLSYGVYFGWMAVLALAVKPFGVDESLAGWLGAAATTAGICSGVCLARFVDYVKSRTKSVLIGLFFGTAIAQLIFTLTCSNIIPYSKAVLFSSIILSGLFFNGTTPLLFEMAIEAVYPIAEGVTAIFLLVISYGIYLFFMIAFMFPSMKVSWMNWATVVFIGLCLPGIMIYKTKFKRLELNGQNGETSPDEDLLK